MAMVDTKQIAKADEEFLREAADRIRLRMSRTTRTIIEIGRELIEVKRRVGHGNFLPWIDREFAMTAKSAERLMSVAEQFGDKIDILSNLLPTVLYELAAPNTTEEVRIEIIDRASSGERINVGDVQALKEKAKDRAYVGEHGTPALVDAVDRGDVSLSAAVAFVRNKPTVQSALIAKALGSAAEAVKKANAEVKARADRAAAKKQQVSNCRFHSPPIRSKSLVLIATPPKNIGSGASVTLQETRSRCAPSGRDSLESGKNSKHLRRL
jgi:hypothetical protein